MPIFSPGAIVKSIFFKTNLVSGLYFTYNLTNLISPFFGKPDSLNFLSKAVFELFS